MQNGWETHTPKEKKHEFKDMLSKYTEISVA